MKIPTEKEDWYRSKTTGKIIRKFVSLDRILDDSSTLLPSIYLEKTWHQLKEIMYHLKETYKPHTIYYILVRIDLLKKLINRKMLFIIKFRVSY